jgi:hypothetical protein
VKITSTSARDYYFKPAEEISGQNGDPIGPMSYTVEKSLLKWFAAPVSLAIREIDNSPSAVPSEITSERGLEWGLKFVRKGSPNEIETPAPPAKAKRAAVKK